MSDPTPQKRSPSGFSLTDRQHLAAQYRTQDNLAVRIRTHQLYSETREDFAAWVLDHIAWTGRERVLDVGCGTGAYAAAAAARAARYVAGDLSLGMLRGLPATVTARANLDLTALPFPDLSFDGVLANHMLYHVADKEAALHAIRRVLRPSGWLLAATNSGDNMGALHDALDAIFAAMGFPERRARRNLIDFTLENGADLLTPYFASVTRYDLPGALVFPAPDPVIAYITSLWEARSGGLRDEAELAAFITAAHAYLSAHIRRHGEFRVPKKSGVFVCRV